MREYMCTCLKCGGQNHLRFDEPYPQYGDQFVRYCRHCEEDTAQTMVLSKKLATQLRKQKAEEDDPVFEPMLGMLFDFSA